MKWHVIWTDPAERDFDRLDRPIARRVVRAIARLAETGQGDLARLRPPEEGFRLRVQDWRVLLWLDDGAGTITLRRIRHRRDAYR